MEQLLVIRTYYAEKHQLIFKNKVAVASASLRKRDTSVTCDFSQFSSDNHRERINQEVHNYFSDICHILKGIKQPKNKTCYMQAQFLNGL